MPFKDKAWQNNFWYMFASKREEREDTVEYHWRRL
jgi:hypothetical protein